MDPKRDTYHVSKCHWFRQACTYLKWDVNLPYKKLRRDLAMTRPTVRRACNTCSWIIRFLAETKKNSNIKRPLASINGAPLFVPNFMIQMLSGNKKYTFFTFQLYARAYVRIRTLRPC